jgi:integrase
MQDYVVNRPREGAMKEILSKNFKNAAGAILRLAWQAGLLREEIRTLTWAQIDVRERVIVLPDRQVPLLEELAAYLTALRADRNHCSEVVVLSDRDKKPLTGPSISRLARQALDDGGETEVRLIDLRHDFVLRLLETHDWQYVSRVTGMEAAALNLHFGAHLEEKRVSTRARRDAPAQIDEFALWKLLQSERDTPVGAALWLTWQLGLQLEEIVSLTWQQVDLEGGLLRLADRDMPLTGGVLAALEALRAASPASEQVLISRRTGRPYDRTRLSRLVRAALVRGGLDDVTLRDLRQDCAIRVGGEPEVVAWLRQNRSITRNEAASLLGVSRTTAYRRLKQMVRRGRLTQIGTRYYLKEAVVPPEQQEAVILEYLSREGFAFRQDIARLLRIDPAQCRPVLQKMVAEGRIVQQRQRYLLPVQKARA